MALEEQPIVSFKKPSEWEKWLSKNHAAVDHVWLRIYKKGTRVQSITYDEALDCALCFGWIDGLRKSYDKDSYIQRFTPRRRNSIWSKRNREHIERLIDAGRMKPSGLAEVQRAKDDGRWAQAYDSPKDMEIPEDFLRELHKSKRAERFYKTLSKANLFAIAWRLQTAKKPETRARRMEALLTMLKEGRKLH